MTRPIDQNILSELSDSIGAGSVSRIVKVFLDELDAQADDIHSNLSEGRMEKISDLAHSLKSTTATFGATDLHLIAVNMEEAADNNERDSLVSLIDELRVCISKTKPLYIPYTERES